MTTYSCHDRMCGADDCRNCHPENFKLRESLEDFDLNHYDPLSALDYNRMADDYERGRNL